MQNNNSKLNTVLLVIVIILLGVGIWVSLGRNNIDKKSDIDIISSNQTRLEESSGVSDYKPSVQDDTEITNSYQYPQTGPAFITFNVKGNPAVSYETTPTRTVFSGTLGVDTIWYVPGMSQSADPCYSPFTDTFYSGQLTFGTKVYNVCSNKGYTYFIQDGFEGTAAIVQTSGENQTAPHYVDPATLTFAMEGEG